MGKDKIFKRTMFLSLVCLMVFSACVAPKIATQPPPSSTPVPTQTPPVVQIMKFEASATSQSTEVPTPEQNLEPTQAPEPTEGSSPTVTVTQAVAESVLADTQTCSRLQSPEPGALLPAVGWGKFEWEAWPQAATYVLEITAPSGWKLTVETDQTSVPRAMEAFDSGGEYTWTVYALSASGQELCRSEAQTFIKPERPASPTPLPRSSRKDRGDEPPCGCGR
jgi:hypothetical protein